VVSTHLKNSSQIGLRRGETENRWNHHLVNVHSVSNVPLFRTSNVHVRPPVLTAEYPKQTYDLKAKQHAVTRKQWSDFLFSSDIRSKVRHSFKGTSGTKKQYASCCGLRSNSHWRQTQPATSGHVTRLSYLVGGWTNPLWKICSSRFVHFPQSSGWKFQTYLSCHHPVTYEPSRNNTPCELALQTLLFFWSFDKNR